MSIIVTSTVIGSYFDYAGIYDSQYLHTDLGIADRGATTGWRLSPKTRRGASLYISRNAHADEKAAQKLYYETAVRAPH